MRLKLAISISIVGIALIGISVLLLNREVVAQSDTEPPHLVSIQVDPSFVDTSLSAQAITVTMHITDNLSGFAASDFSFAKLSSSGMPEGTYLILRGSELISGTITNGVFRTNEYSQLPQYSVQGRWYLQAFGLYDKTGNSCVWASPEGSRKDPECAPAGDLPYFVNGVDSGPPATATPTLTLTPDPNLAATQTAISKQIATAVAATMTAISRATPKPSATPQPGGLYLPSVKQKGTVSSYRVQAN